MERVVIVKEGRYGSIGIYRDDGGPKALLLGDFHVGDILECEITDYVDVVRLIRNFHDVRKSVAEIENSLNGRRTIDFVEFRDKVIYSMNVGTHLALYSSYGTDVFNAIRNYIADKKKTPDVVLIYNKEFDEYIKYGYNDLNTDEYYFDYICREAKVSLLINEKN